MTLWQVRTEIGIRSRIAFALQNPLSAKQSMISALARENQIRSLCSPSEPFYSSLHFQVAVAIALGIIVGCIAPAQAVGLNRDISHSS